MENFVDVAYLISAISFIYGLKMLRHPRTARKGNIIASIGMLIAVVATVMLGTNLNLTMIIIAMSIGSIIGAFFAIRVEMTQMPQLVAIFNGVGGGASALVASAEFLKGAEGLFAITAITLSVLIGTLTFTGSFIAFGKLQGVVTTKPVTFPGQQVLNALLAIVMFGCAYMILQNPNDGMNLFYIILGLSGLLGVLLVIPIGGADMPVVISLLNSYSGIAAAMTGFVLVASGNNSAGNALIICGSLVGASATAVVSPLSQEKE